MVHINRSNIYQDQDNQSFLDRYCYYPSHKLQPPLLFDQSSVSSPSSSSPSSPPLSAEDEITTIFAVGFPDDMHEREFTNMFSFAKGFLACSLKWHRKEQSDMVYSANKHQMIGFARFNTRKEAHEAIHILNNRKIGNEKGYVLKAEMAKKNLHIKPTVMPSESKSLPNLAAAIPFDSYYQDEDYYRQPPMSRKTSQLSIFSLSPIENNAKQIEPFLPIPSDYSSIEESISGINKTPFFHLPYHLNETKMKTDAFTLFQAPLPDSETNLKPIQAGKKTIDQNPPCNTLYVGNLSANTNMEEIRKLFSACNGYKRMNFRQKLQGPMCFIEFEDVLFAIQAMHQYQGYRLSNSTKAGIRLSFSKNPLFIKSSAPSSSPLASSVKTIFQHY
ncbi:Cell wall integrity protein scw1 [Choanephora cucurbitarum]|uniref:Cell wall integrity protein scw1 n=1 Tax=Choanephora cucurbitarum TaxID=101091 RepID=A0A1C7NC87_9FUNG|nr:Cell wall integrity protein scw1 [Choanephora cucurbitarum]